MADAVIEFQDAGWRDFFKKTGARLAEAAPILKRLYGTIGFRDIMAHFKKEEGPDGKWKPRSQFTQERYEAIRRGDAKPDPGVSRGAYSPTNKLLQLTGTMRSSVMPGNARRLDARSIIAWANDPKSGQHDRGKESGFPRIPARPFMWLSNTAKRDVANAAARYMLDA